VALGANQIEIKPLLTGLGIGGIAIALAVQNILGDLFAAIAIVLDKPFVVGDSISVENYRGKVENKIGRAPGRERGWWEAEDGIRDLTVTGVQTCALPILLPSAPTRSRSSLFSPGWELAVSPSHSPCRTFSATCLPPSPSCSTSRSWWVILSRWRITVARWRTRSEERRVGNEGGGKLKTAYEI